MREVITMGRLHDNPSHPAAAALGQMFDPFGLVEHTRDLVSGGTTADPIPSPAPQGNPPTTAASTSYEVTASGLWVRATPSAAGQVVGETMKGEIVTFLGETSGEWYLIRNARGTSGWSSSKYLRAAGSQSPQVFDTPPPGNYIELDGQPPPNLTTPVSSSDHGMGGTTVAALVLGVLAVGGLYYYYTQD